MYTLPIVTNYIPGSRANYRPEPRAALGLTWLDRGERRSPLAPRYLASDPLLCAAVCEQCDHRLDLSRDAHSAVSRAEFGFGCRSCSANMACSARPLHELAKHVSPASFIPPQPSARSPSSYSASSSPPSSFRLLGAKSVPSGHNGNGNTDHHQGLTSPSNRSTKMESLDADWAAFATGPSSQVEAMPPTHASTSSFPGAASLSSSSSSSSYFDADKEDASPLFSPEQQTLSAIQWGFSSPNWSGTPSSSMAGPMYMHRNANASFVSSSSGDLPTAEEAFSVASTPPTSQIEGGSGAHPLTMEVTSYNRWDFDQLFNKPQRWSEGRRGLFDDNEQDDRENDKDRGRRSTNTLGRRSSRSAAGRVLIERSIDQRRSRSLVGASAMRKGGESSLSRLSQEILRPADSAVETAGSASMTDPTQVDGIPVISDEERQKLAFEQLRKVAMERLQAVGAHLDWAQTGSK
ncbi:BZ3500_MvSof-1268-A1-R1_Chr7-1g09285 [Microbotryum saponariae]|uniref:BZ3500_MvSof-1268-A1-R1_Chr7-1g09285 protein n=1 Tax=Microbotryum saponariae TaxID=289078 RepID=A0A2X0LE43_9BASI|nr:BZ3501_MvSof-1269-A2-R1_Chr7-1g08990 [Microbotryum saponariae]SDA03158.1 BZ3500_MvSof-1268-A1-R1_Chr7-1g09285 [Microbotryum saponariae]